MRIKMKLTVFSAMLVMITACSTAPICISPSNTPLYDKTVSENLGKTSGENSAYSVLGLYMIGRPDVEAALKEALDQKKGDALINVRCYEKSSYFLLFSVNTVIVEGEAVKYAPTEEHKGKKR